MKSSIKEHLKQQAFHYLDENLDVQIKKEMPPNVIMQLLDCLSDWLYEERQNVLHEFARQVILKVQNKVPGDGSESSDFMKELQKL